MKKIPGILRSSASMTLARVLSSVCSFALFWFIAQKSVRDLGAFRTILVFFLFTEFLPLLGANQLVIREVSISRNPVKKYLMHSFIFSLPVSLVVSSALVLLGMYGKYSLTISKGLIILSFGMPATSMVTCAQSVLIGVGRGDLFGIIQSLEAVVRTLTGIFLLFLGHGILSIVVSFVLIRWSIIIFYWLSLNTHLKPGKWNIDLGFFKEFVWEVPPFAGILLCYVVLRFAPQIMLPWMKGEVAAGHFAVAFQFLDLALLAPTAFAVNLMPLFAQRAQVSISSLVDISHQAIKIVSLIILAGVATVFIVAQPLVLTVFGGKYIQSVPVLKVLIWVAIILSIDQVLAMATIASKNQIYDLLTLCIGGFVTVILLYFLISQKGALGAAEGYLLGTSVLLICRVFLAKKFMPGLNPVLQLWRPILAVTIVICIGHILNCYWLLSLLVGIGTYVLSVFVLGALKGSERIAMKRLLCSTVER